MNADNVKKCISLTSSVHFKLAEKAKCWMEFIKGQIVWVRYGHIYPNVKWFALRELYNLIWPSGRMTNDTQSFCWHYHILFALYIVITMFVFQLQSRFLSLSLPHPQYTCLVLNHARFSNSTWIFYSVCLPLWFHARKFVAVSRRFRSCGMKITYISAINLIWLSMVFDFFRPSVRPFTFVLHSKLSILLFVLLVALQITAGSLLPRHMYFVFFFW